MREMLMREVQASTITETVARLAKEANIFLGEDVIACLRRARAGEPSPVGQEVLDQILSNAQIAAQTNLPLCQDTGYAVVYLDLGQDVHIVGGDITAAVNEGIRRAYKEGYLRKSIVEHPFSTRINTRDNTPCVLHTEVVPGEQVTVTVLTKGGGSENMSYLRMLTPSAGRQGVVDFVVECVDKSGANPCPPIIVGVGIGGTADQAMAIAKRSLLREVDKPNADPEVADLEQEILRQVNQLGLGPMALGGVTTALAVHVETYPAHIASMPVAVNLQCHSARSKSATL
jgi:fumarate hydratase subunit alpha